MVDPIAVTATVAVALHKVDAQSLREVLGEAPTRREHLLSQLDLFEQDEQPVLQDALAWCRDHLPPDTPGRLLHGDLLGQNIIVEEAEGIGSSNCRVSVIDWSEARLGDPAYDLAIITRGHRRLYKQPSDTLLEAYNEQADEPLSVDHLRTWELWLKTRLYLNVLETKGRCPHADSRLNEVRSVLKRCSR